jgi:hypothetical protein
VTTTISSSGASPVRRFGIFRFVNGEPHSLTGSYDTIEEVRKHKWRTDWDQRVYRSLGKVLDEARIRRMA